MYVYHSSFIRKNIEWNISQAKEDLNAFAFIKMTDKMAAEFIIIIVMLTNTKMLSSF